MNSTHNPLLQTETLPLFDQITSDEVKPAIKMLIEKNRAVLSELLPAAEPTWDTLIAPLEEVDDKLSHAWSIVKHLKTVMLSEDLVKVYTECLPEVSDYFTALSQNQLLFEAYEKISKSQAFSTFSNAQKKTIEHALRDFKLAGVHLPEKEKKQYAAIVKRISELESQFENNLIKSTDHWSYYSDNPEELKGIPEHALMHAKRLAAEKGLSGWVLTLDFPTYFAVLTYADNRQLREKIYTAYVTRASDQSIPQGQFDNTEVMNEILRLRSELSKLLGFSNYAELSLATKMVKKPSEVLDFLWDLVEKCQEQARKEFDEVAAMAKANGVEDLAVWDVSYFSEKLKSKQFDFNEEDLRPYFPENAVLKGLFQIASRVFNISIEEGKAPSLWHPDVRFFSIKQNETIIGCFYLDLYARANKRSGAWMDECQMRRKKIDGTLQKPVAYLICNFNSPTDGEESLLSHDEVMTLFHEFGHGLQHLLTKVDVASVSGIHGIEWDAVELPSQFMEHWCWDWESLQIISGHIKTKEKLPRELFEKLTAAKHFQSGMQLLKQLEYSLFDFNLHRFYDGTTKAFVQDTLDKVRQKLSLIPVPAFNRFQHSFSHIFSGAYAAGYYSYLWAEVLACDAFSKFEEEGLFNTETGQLFRDTVLALGASKDAIDVFVAFRGRKPSMGALLAYRGILHRK